MSSQSHKDKLVMKLKRIFIQFYKTFCRFPIKLKQNVEF